MVIIIRHGQTYNNTKNIYCGKLNSDLTEEGIKQINDIAENIKLNYHSYRKINFYVSSLNRCRESLKIILNYLPADSIMFADSLQERDYGDEEGKTPLISVNSFNWKPVAGESIGEVFVRVSNFIDREHIRESNYDDSVLNIFVTHYCISKVLRGIYLKTSPVNFMEFVHNQDTFYVIKGNFCEEITIHDNTK